MKRDEKKPLISEFIMRAVRDKPPVTVRQLAARVQQEYRLSEKKAVKQIVALQSHGSLRLEGNPNSQSATLLGYLRCERSLWYWLTISLATATTLIVFTVPDDLYPLVYARYALGSIFVLLLPGYSFIKALFPTKVPITTGKKN